MAANWNACGLVHRKSAEQGIPRMAISLKTRLLNVILFMRQPNVGSFPRLNNTLIYITEYLKILK